MPTPPALHQPLSNARGKTKKNNTWTHALGKLTVGRWQVWGAGSRERHRHLWSSPVCVGLCLPSPFLPCHPGGRFHFIDEEVETQIGCDTAIKCGSQDLSPGLPWLGHQARPTSEINKTSKRNTHRPGAGCEPTAVLAGAQKGSGRSQE